MAFPASTGEIRLLSKSYKRSLLIGLILLAAGFYAWSLRPTLKQIKGETMGTTYSITYVSTPFSHSTENVKKQVDKLLEAINDSMSTYREDSELMQFNRAEVGKPFKASDELVDLVERSLVVSRMSNGAYDVTVGPLVNLWGFGPAQASGQPTESKKASSDSGDKNAPEFVEWMMNNYPAELPSDEEIAAAQAKVGYQAIVADTRNDLLTRTKDVFVDLSSIAKGYGVDKVAALLESEGINSYLVEIGGEIKVGGPKPDGAPWKLGIRGPAMANSQPALIVELENKAMATSGDYLNYFEVDGKKYSHTINPRTGHPEMGRLAEVAVIEDNVAEADALATMFMVLGDKEGLKLANREGIAAYFTYHTDNGYEAVSSDAFKPYLPKQH
ncbi:FAD:protein FMN transferase [Endozoicomonas sp. 4G]|uniref:FAD:protein FMN transferase n=1 Tax=Endozoicomonas sp. 4G TaxID=2872754 RepID=UPI002078D6DF|nr:FAD:protein FMN transferase [Endozoicomonas sp. 4G]